MTTRDQTIAGGRELDDFLRTLAPKMQKNVNRAGLRAGAVILLPEVKSRIPVATGALRDSARVTSRAKGDMVSASVKVGNREAWYSHLVEYGTRPHVERPRRDHAMRFGGTTVREVHHPGIAPHPFMRPAIDQMFPVVVQAVTNKIRERLTKAGLNASAPLPSDPEE